MRWRSRALFLLLVQAAAFWPVWRWVAARVADGSGDGAALAACAAALLIRPPAGGPDTAGDSWFPFVPATVLTLLYAGAAAWGPPLLAAAIAFAALLVSWSAWRWGGRPHPGAIGLVLLALPAVPTAQFLLGFPLRVAAGEIAARLLALGGLAVERQGALLRYGERVVAVDAPCSGVHMLWTALLVGFALAVLGGLDRRRTALLTLAAGGLALAGNALRAAALFLPESGLLTLPPGSHDGIGLTTFALTVLPLLLLWNRLRNDRLSAERSTPRSSGVGAVSA